MTAFDLLSKPQDQSGWLDWGSPWIWLLYSANQFPNTECWCEFICPLLQSHFKKTLTTPITAGTASTTPFGESAFYEALARAKKPWNQNTHRGRAESSNQLKVLCVVIFQLAYFMLHPSVLLNTLGHKGGFLIHFVSREAAGDWGLVPLWRLHKGSLF